MFPRSESTEPVPEPVSEPVQGVTVFQGSSPEDVSHARRLWSSLSLLPPQESRLVSTDIRQRLPVSRGRRQRSTVAPEPPAQVREAERQEERRRYEAMAENRRHILGLLRKQREQRIQKELLSMAHKPKPKPKQTEGPGQNRDRDGCEGDPELVQQLN